MKKIYRIIGIALACAVTLLILAACNNAQNSAVQVIEAYIRALSKQDADQISSISCADWEQNALLEIDSLSAVGSKVENLSCQISGQDGADVYVSCTGVLSLDYNGEAQTIDLSSHTYVARKIAGDWRMCGYR